MAEPTAADLPDDHRLATILRSVGEHLVVDDVHGESPETPQRIATERAIKRAQQNHRHRRVFLAIAAAVVVIAVVLTVPPARHAVARWIGVGNTEIRSDADGDPAGLPALEDNARTVSPTEAVSVLGRSLPDSSSTALGPPQRLAHPPEGGVIMMWAQGATTLWIHRSDLAVGIYVKKLATVGTSIEFIDNLGDEAVLVRGTHVLITPGRRLAAGTALLWTADSFEYRLESDLPSNEMVAIARTITQ